MIAKKIILVLVAVAAAVIGYWLISPLFIEKEVSEKLEDIMPVSSEAPNQETPMPASQVLESQLKIVSSGTFTGLANHSAEGTATLVKIGDKYYVRLEDDFRVTNGPDLFVHFGKNGKYSADARLGALKGNVGGQNYEVPAEINPLDYNEVWIWCRSFFVPFGKAVLK
ncbi:MAG: DM13 domain-containing protein [bacterium]|nr:DM13 domain-containing protein [bacterium]